VLMVVGRRRGSPTPDETAPIVRFAGWTAIGMATVSVLLVPLLAAALFTKAAWNQHQRGSWSMASGNLRTITGSSCGIADAVRVRIGGTQRSLAEVTAPAAGPVLADWPISFALPCLHLPALADGMVAPPRLLLTAPKPFTDDGAADRHYRPFGGAFAGVGAVADYQEIPTRLVGSNDQKAWGSLFAVDYKYRTDGFEVHRTRVERTGWWRGPTYASEEYIGQPPPR
jgi:hypothetical protein